MSDHTPDHASDHDTDEAAGAAGLPEGCLYRIIATGFVLFMIWLASMLLRGLAG